MQLSTPYSFQYIYKSILLKCYPLFFQNKYINFSFYKLKHITLITLFHAFSAYPEIRQCSLENSVICERSSFLCCVDLYDCCFLLMYCIYLVNIIALICLHMCVSLLDSNIFERNLLSLCHYIPSISHKCLLNEWMNFYPWHFDSEWANSHFFSFKERLKWLYYLLAELKLNHVLKDKGFYFIFTFELIHK